MRPSRNEEDQNPLAPQFLDPGRVAPSAAIRQHGMLRQVPLSAGCYKHTVLTLANGRVYLGGASILLPNNNSGLPRELMCGGKDVRVFVVNRDSMAAIKKELPAETM
jgi:hypothetical protein